MKYFTKKTVNQKYPASKKDIKNMQKELIKMYNYKLEENQYTILKYKNKFSLIADESNVNFFCLDKKFYPTINFLNLVEEFEIININLDIGARKPIISGANVMGKGIYVNFDRTDNFVKNDCVKITIEDEIIGIGKAMVNKKDITKNFEGEAIEIYHVLDDDLHKNLYLY